MHKILSISWSKLCQQNFSGDQKSKIMLFYFQSPEKFVKSKVKSQGQEVKSWKMHYLDFQFPEKFVKSQVQSGGQKLKNALRI